MRMGSVLTDQEVTMTAQEVTTKDQELGCSWLKVLAQGLQPSPGRGMANTSHTGVAAKPWDSHGEQKPSNAYSLSTQELDGAAILTHSGLTWTTGIKRSSKDIVL